VTGMGDLLYLHQALVTMVDNSLGPIVKRLRDSFSVSVISASSRHGLANRTRRSHISR
jgi:hypothetical protein